MAKKAKKDGRGRPKKSKSEKRGIYTGFWQTPKERKALEAAIKSAEIGKAEFIRECLFKNSEFMKQFKKL